MKKLYEKNELTFALVWIGLYVVVMNIALQFCGGFDDLASKTALQVLVPVICICVLAVISTVWIIQNGLSGKYGLCRFKGTGRHFLYFIPMIIMSCVNLKNGLGLNAPGAVVLLMMVNLAVGGLCGRDYLPGLSIPCHGERQSALCDSGVGNHLRRRTYCKSCQYSRHPGSVASGVLCHRDWISVHDCRL